MYTIKRYNASNDVDLIHKLDHSIFKQGSSKKELEKMNGWVAWDGDDIVGYLVYTTIDNKNLFLETIGVDSKYRGKGIGSELMEKIIYKADENEQNIHLYINKQHRNLVEFYELFNFQIKNSVCAKHYTSITMYRHRVMK